jgi:hypothetical protein
MNRCALLVAPAALALAAASASATHVNIELSLLVDVSGSVDATEYALQRTGYANAFINLNFNSVIGAGNSVAVNMIEWDGNANQQQVVAWTLIDSQAAAVAFGNAIAAHSRAFPGGNTAVGQAITFGRNSIFNNNFDSDRQVIDVSGDGADNVNFDPYTAQQRDAALAAGIDQINGLVILGEGGLEAWYNANVKGGANAFVQAASGFDTFGDAIDAKLHLELGGGVPLPSAAGLGFLGLGVLGVQRRRR